MFFLATTRRQNGLVCRLIVEVITGGRSPAPMTRQRVTGDRTLCAQAFDSALGRGLPSQGTSETGLFFSRPSFTMRTSP